MNVLVLGGTRFVGRHVVAAALAAGHAVSTFTRGRSPVRLDGVEMLHGNRDGDVNALRGRRWDLVVDTSAYHPRQVQNVAAVMGTVGRYVFISTGSVYRTFPETGATESAVTHRAMRDSLAEPGPSTYGPLKVACEDAVARLFPECAIVLRPGLIAGPHDPTRRFPYWVQRIAAGGEVLAPGDPERIVQVLDARDLADWVFRIPAEIGEAVFNVAGPSAPLTMRRMLEGCRGTLSSNARFTWVSDEFLVEHGVAPWLELPLWIPDGVGVQLRVDDAKARSQGFRNRPLAETIFDVARNLETNDEPLDGGLPKARPISRERERSLLDAWHL